MNTFKSTILAVALAMIVGDAGTAMAEDFVFTVPLKLQNLHPEIDVVWLGCQTLDKSGSVVGGAVKIIPVGPNRTLSQDMVIAFDTLANHIVSDATQYRCAFQLHAKSDPAELFHTPDSLKNSPSCFQYKPGTPFVSVVSGPIPLQTEMKQLFFNN